MQLLSLFALATAVFSAPVAQPQLSLGKLALGSAAIIGTSVAIAEGVKKNKLKNKLQEQQYAAQQQNAVIQQQQQQIQSFQQQQQQKQQQTTYNTQQQTTVPAYTAPYAYKKY